MNETKPPMRTLPLCFQHDEVGQLQQDTDGQFHFIYNDEWQEKGFPISPNIPFSGEADSETIANFLRNLFPEGEAFDVLLSELKARKNNVLSILQAIGQDAPGAISFGRADAEDASLRQITKQELTDRLNTGDPRELLVWDGKYRLSVSGVQRKLNVLKQGDELFLADGGHSSTHILKFAKPEHQHLVANEYVCMKLAKEVGLDVANVEHLQFGPHPSLLVERFDREDSGHSVLKKHCIDGCQLLNIPPEYKYEQVYGSNRDVAHIRKGASLPKLFEAADQAQIPAKARQTILSWMLFNLVIGNSDAHGKNISFFADRYGFDVSPMYDLVSISFEARFTDRLDDGLAMAIDDEFDPSKVTAYNLLSLAEKVGLPFSLLKRRLIDLTKRIDTRVGSIDLSVLASDDTGYASALIEFIRGRSAYFHAQADEFEFVARSLLERAD